MEILQNGSKKWPISKWEKLLNLALPVLYDLPNDTIWSLGGGTALYITIDHRISYDIDIFFDKTIHLKQIAKNPKTKLISDNWHFPGNYLKLITQDGEIDFISSVTVLDKPFYNYDFNNNKIKIDTPGEIIAKKIYNRSSTFSVRDVFDLVAVIKFNPDIINDLIENIRIDNFKTALNRTYLLKNNFPDIQTFITPTKLGKQLINNVYDIAIDILNDCIKK